MVLRAVYVTTGSYYLGLALALAATVAVASLVHVFVETPANNLGRRLARREREPPVEPSYVAVAPAGDLRP